MFPPKSSRQTAAEAALMELTLRMAEAMLFYG
jgi:hypothetical protein